MDTAILVTTPDGHGLSTRESSDGFAGDVHKHLARCPNTWLFQQFAALAMHDSLPFEFESHLNRDDNTQYNNNITNNFDNRKNITKCPCSIEYEDDDDEYGERRCTCCIALKDKLCDNGSSKNDGIFNPCCGQECTVLDCIHCCCWEEKERASLGSLQDDNMSHNHSVHDIEEPNEYVSTQVENGHLLTSSQILIGEASQSHMQLLDQINTSYPKHSDDDIKQSNCPVKEQNACPEIIDKNIMKQLVNNGASTAHHDVRAESDPHFEHQPHANTNTNKCPICTCTYCWEEPQNFLEFADLTEDDYEIDPCDNESICEVLSCPNIVKPRRQMCSCDRKLSKKMKDMTRLRCRGKKSARRAVEESNHKLPCRSRRQKLNQDLLRVTDENFSLSAMNYELRNSIRHERESTISECVRILDSIIKYCERKSRKTCTRTRKRKKSCHEIARVRLCNARIRNENYLLRSTLKNLRDHPHVECAKVLSSVINHCTKARNQRKDGAADPKCRPPPRISKSCTPLGNVSCNPVCRPAAPKFPPYKKHSPPLCPAPFTKTCPPQCGKSDCTYCCGKPRDPYPQKCYCDCCRPPLWEPKKGRRNRPCSVPRTISSPCGPLDYPRACSPPCLPRCTRPCSPCLPSECSRPCPPICRPDPGFTCYSRRCPSPCVTRCRTRSPPKLFPRVPKGYSCLRCPVDARSFNYCKHNNEINDESTSNSNQERPSSPKDDNRMNDDCTCSCGYGMCGGYTPSGWNKLRTKHSLECTDRCCLYCCPPCPPCPNCTPCTCAIACICPSPRSRSPSPCARSKPKRKIASSTKNASNSWSPSEGELLIINFKPSGLRISCRL